MSQEEVLMRIFVLFLEGCTDRKLTRVTYAVCMCVCVAGRGGTEEEVVRSWIVCA